MSMMKSGRSSRSCKSGARFSRVTIGVGAAVDEIKISTSRQWVSQSSIAHRPTADERRERFRAFDRPVRYPNIAHPPLDERARRALARFPGAEQEHFARFEIAENLFRQIDRDRTDRDRTARDFSPGPDLFRDPKGALEKSMQKRPGRAGFARRGIGLFRLAENLGLADDHRVEPGSDAKKMLHALLGFVPIEDLDFVRPRSHPGGEQAMRDPLGRDRLRRTRHRLPPDCRW